MSEPASRVGSLTDELHLLIATEGPISVERYMQLCLQHPVHGYYTTRDAIGCDFTTAPEIDQMFGELLGLWAAQVWLAMGSPPALRLVELGPGRGTLMADALRATRTVPGFHDAVSVDLVETSPRLRSAQRDRLAGAAGRVAWFDAIDALPGGPAIILANEIFDALPVRHYICGASGWHERLVGLREGCLAFGAARDAIPDVPATAAAASGQILEVGHAALAVVAALAGRIAREGGALLACDYGHGASGFGETLQAVKGSGYADVLAAPGEADLTVHVDFAALAGAARAAGAEAHGPVEQGLFLRRLGIEARAASLSRRAEPHQARAIEAALARFTSPSSSMATLFKAFAVGPRGAPVPPGFDVS